MAEIFNQQYVNGVLAYVSYSTGEVLSSPPAGAEYSGGRWELKDEGAIPSGTAHPTQPGFVWDANFQAYIPQPVPSEYQSPEQIKIYLAAHPAVAQAQVAAQTAEQQAALRQELLKQATISLGVNPAGVPRNGEAPKSVPATGPTHPGLAIAGLVGSVVAVALLPPVAVLGIAAAAGGYIVYRNGAVKS